MSMHTVDDLLNKNLTPAEPETVQTVSMDKEESSPRIPAQEEDTSEPEKLSYLEQFRKDKEEILGKKEPEPVEIEKKTEETAPETPVKAEKSQEIDEYGTEVAKAKTYTEE